MINDKLVTHTVFQELDAKLGELEALHEKPEVNSEELKTLIDRIADLGQKAMVEYSQMRAAYSQTDLSSYSSLINRTRVSASKTRALLQKRRPWETQKKITLLFTPFSPSSSSGKEPLDAIQRGEGVSVPSSKGKSTHIEKECVRNLTHSLTKLEESIKDLQLNGLVVEHFKQSSTFPERLAILKDNFIAGFFNTILAMISKGIFRGRKSESVRNAKAEKLKQKETLFKKKEGLQARQDNLTVKLNKLKELQKTRGLNGSAQLNQLEDAIKQKELLLQNQKGDFFSQFKINVGDLLYESLLMKAKEALQRPKSQRNDASDAKCNALIQASEQIKQTKRDLFVSKESKKSLETSLPLEMENLELEINRIETEIEGINKEKGQIDISINNINSKSKDDLGRNTRDNFTSIGGAQVKIELVDATLDGMYISCDAFRENLKRGGAQTYTLTSQVSSSGDNPQVFTGISFPPGSSSQTVDKALTELGAFDGAGWQKIVLADQTTLIVSDQEAEIINLLIEDRAYTIENKEWDVGNCQTGGTVLLTSGNAGVYEMHKREILGFLMRGMNVMTFNFRGYGESEGVPTGEGLKRDMEAAYQYLKEKHEIPDEKVMLKALCMSGGPATSLAAKHPKVNLFLDQTYANFDEIIEEQVKNYIDEFVLKNGSDKADESALRNWFKENMISVSHALVKMTTPAWSVEKEICKVEGHVALLLAENDGFVSLDRDVAKNYEAVLREGNASSHRLFSIEGKHAGSWLTSASLTGSLRKKEYLGRVQMDDYLKQAHLSASFV